MPDSKGLLEQPERDAIAAAMQGKLKPADCPWCGVNKWEVGPSLIVSLPLLGDGRVSVVGPLIPMVTLLSPCGYVAHFAAVKFGLQVNQSAGTPTPAPAAG
ncbi:MAG: hypothetical protein WDN08_03050 [Rhizomicrobium sp.]